MLARSYIISRRYVPFNAVKSFRTIIQQPCRIAARRTFHATGEFTYLGPEGTLVTKEISIRVGDPGEAYVCVPTEVGYALQASSYLTKNSSALPKRPDRLALSYFHDTQHFALGKVPPVSYLVIAANITIFRLITRLPSPSYPSSASPQSAADRNPATLYLYGVMHTIALDGTSDDTSPRPLYPYFI